MLLATPYEASRSVIEKEVDLYLQRKIKNKNGYAMMSDSMISDSIADQYNCKMLLRKLGGLDESSLYVNPTFSYNEFCDTISRIVRKFLKNMDLERIAHWHLYWEGHVLKIIFSYKRKNKI